MYNYADNTSGDGQGIAFLFIFKPNYRKLMLILIRFSA